jgi:glycosyltransferase involved in cell wall biosynthesis
MTRRRRTILHIINTAEIGGGMKHVHALFRNLPRERFELHLAADEGRFLVDEIRALDAPVHFLPLMRRRANPRAVWAIARLARRTGADLLHLHGTRAAFYGALAKPLAGSPQSIYTVHGFSFHKDVGPAGRAFYLTVERCCARAHTRVISVSGADRDEAIRLGVCPPWQIQTIRNAADFAVFDPAAADGWLRRTFGFGSEQPVVGAAARLVPQKGLEYFLEMAKLVAGRRADARFVIVGEGCQNEALQSRARRLGLEDRVVFAGPQNQMAECYAGLDVFVLSSLWEGHPLALIESLAMERPTVATRTSGSPEIIDDGETGFIVEPKDPLALADRVLWLLDHPDRARDMAREGRRRCLRRFSEQAMAVQTMRLYEELLPGPS